MNTLVTTNRILGTIAFSAMTLDIVPVLIKGRWGIYSNITSWALLFTIAAVASWINKGKSHSVAELILVFNIMGILYSILLFMAVTVEC
jgi:hypothetical protein